MNSPLSPSPGLALRRLLVAVVATATLATACGSGDKPEVVAGSTVPPAAAPTSAAEAPATSAPDPNRQWVAESLAEGEHEVFESPGGELKTTLRNPWVGDSPLVFLVIDEPADEWLEVYLPIRPNGSTGYVRSDDVTVYNHNYRLEVNLGEFSLTAYQGDVVLLDTQVAVAADNTPTPGGLYYITELLGEFTPDYEYGTYAYGLSGYSEVWQEGEFRGGPGQLGIHGTNRPELIGQAVSNGCIRMRNEDIEQLVTVLPLGVPVTVIA